MPLTLDIATQAGQLAAAITVLNGLIAGVQAAIDGNFIVTQINVRLQHPDGTTDAMSGDITLTITESASIFNDVIALYESRLTSLNAQLAALVP